MGQTKAGEEPAHLKFCRLVRLFPFHVFQFAGFSSLFRIMATFGSVHDYEIEYEYDFWISDQLRSQRPRSSLLLTSREEGL